MPEPSRSSTETSATFEKRGTATARPGAAEPGGSASPSTSRPTSPPSQTEPAARWIQSSASERPRGAVCAAWPAAPGTTSTAAAAASAPPVGEQLGDRALLALGPVDPERDARREREQREADLQVEEAAAERRRAHQRHERADVDPRAQRELGRRAQQVERDRDQRRRRAATPNATSSERRLAPGTRRTSGRAIAMRSTNRPIAIITARKTTERAATRLGVAAVSEIDGTGNCGAGPGFGPTWNVNAPRTGWPSTEITRQ